MKEAIKEVLREFYQDGQPSGIVPRDIAYFENATAATVVKGMRRTGKTYVTYERMAALKDSGVPWGRIVHLNFEDDRIKSMRLEDLHLINEIHAELFPEYAHEKCWYFLDELQNVEGWEAYARRLVDSPKVVLCLTGSSSRLLSEEIATAMRGRSIPIEVFPLSFPEFLRFNGIMETAPDPKRGFTGAERGILRNAARRYLDVGGFPAVQGMPDAMRIATLQGYVHAVLYRDVLQRHRVASVQSLLCTLDYLLHNFARRTSAHAISGVLRNLSYPSRREDIADYISYFKDAYLIHPVSVMSGSLAVKRVNPDKYYIVDTGLVRAMSVKNDAERGWLLENLVFMALRRGLNKIEYVTNPDGTEVDFHVVDMVTKKRRLVQAAWTLQDRATAARETAALELARRNLRVDDCTIVTWDDEAELDSGIKVVPVWKWLLDENNPRNIFRNESVSR